MNPIMILMCGMTASGKSTVSNKLSNELGIRRICTDDIRIKLPSEATQILHGNPLLRYVVYYQTLRLAEKILATGESVIIDGTYSKKDFREGAYFIASKTGASIYIIECYLNNYRIISQRFEKRKSNPIFKEWAQIESYHKKFLDFENLEREVLPDGRPVPIIRYNSENGKAEIIYSDGSEEIEMILQAITAPERVKV